jgi:hypothetical protein
MRLRELLEGKFFKSEDFVSPSPEGRKINFDLAEDLIHFMNHDDHVYRRHFFPAIHKAVDMHKENKTPKASIFKSAVEECYQTYLREFPIRELPAELDKDQLDEICSKICEQVLEHIADGKYED